MLHQMVKSSFEIKVVDVELCLTINSVDVKSSQLLDCLRKRVCDSWESCFL